MASTGVPSLSRTARLPNGTAYGFVHVEPSGGKQLVLLTCASKLFL